MALLADVPTKVKAWGGAIVVVAGLAGLIGWKADRPAWSSELEQARAELTVELEKVKTQVAGFRETYRKGQGRSDCRQINIQLMLTEGRVEQSMNRYRDMKAKNLSLPSSLINRINRLRRQMRHLEDQRRKLC